MFGKAPITGPLSEGLKVTSWLSWLPAGWGPPCIPGGTSPLGSRHTSSTDSKFTGSEAPVLSLTASAFHIRPFLGWPFFTSHSFLKGLLGTPSERLCPRFCWKLCSCVPGWKIPSGNPWHQYLQVSRRLVRFPRKGSSKLPPSGQAESGVLLQRRRGSHPLYGKSHLLTLFLHSVFLVLWPMDALLMFLKDHRWTSLWALWIRIHWPVQGTWVWLLVWEDVTCCGAPKPLCYSYWVCILGPVWCNYWSPCVWSPSSATRDATTLRSPRITTRE